MKYKVGDKVRIKSLDWYNENKDETDDIECSNNIWFYREMSKFCGKVMTISHVRTDRYTMVEDLVGYWTDEMIEGLVEKETKPESRFKVGDKITNGKGALTILTLTPDSYIVEDTFGECGTLYFKYQDKWKIVKEETKPNIIEEAKTYWDSIKDALICPEGYQFVDENGNVINATKIVLEKKEKEYPKTYKECCKVMNYCCNPVSTKTTHKEGLIRKFQFLLMYRDTYWKIAGEEMGLGKPWEPNWRDDEKKKYTIEYYDGEIIKGFSLLENRIFSFPTPEMRDAFYENFKSEIEFCKELL